MNYPIISEYIEAIKAAEENLAQLKQLRPVLEEDGQPVMSSGNFAVVFKMKDEQTGKLYAVKCFLKEQEGRAEAYRLIAEELEYVSSTFLTPIRYLDKELFVDTNTSDETEFPVLLMDWVEGQTLDKYIREHIYDQYDLSLLAYQFSRLAMWLIPQPFAHGDLKPDNILVKDDGTLALVDYDGMYVPAMKGQKARELGSPDFRHPSRTEDVFDEHIDDFSLVSILLSLKAIFLKPELLKQYGAADRLLFSANDYRNLSESQIMDAIKAMMQDSELATLYSLFILSSAQNNLSQASFRLLNLKRPQVPAENLSTEVTEEDLASVWVDEYGVKYSADKKRLLHIPDDIELNKYYIKEGTLIICDGAFVDRIDLEFVSIPESVIVIGYDAFCGCKKLTANIPNKIKIIEERAFMGCSHLESVHIPKTVEFIGEAAFSCCKGLSTIVVDKENRNYDSRNNCNAIIKKDKGVLISGCFNTTIPSGISKIGNSAFYGCSNLLSISLPNGITEIEDYAFSECSSLQSIYIPESISIIGANTFRTCSGLTSIIVDKNNKRYDSRNNCNAIIDSFSNSLLVGCLNSIIPDNVKKLEDFAFSRCIGLKTIVIPLGVQEIGNGVFDNCQNLESIDISKSVIKIGKWAFRGCKNITNINLHADLKEIGESAFNKCEKLQSIIIPNGIEKIESWLFDGCSSLCTIDIPFTIKEIGFSAFRGCACLASIDIPDNVNIISSHAFEGCCGFSSFDIPKNVTKIGDYAFAGCSHIESITIPDSVLRIGSGAFKDCTSLSSVVLSNNITRIEHQLFYGCKRLQSICFPHNITDISSDAFALSSITSVFIPKSVSSINKTAFMGCSKLESIVVEEGNSSYDSRNNCNAIIETKNNKLIRGCSKTIIPDTVITIGKSAFSDCFKLKSIKIPYNIKTIEDYAFGFSLNTLIINNDVIDIDKKALFRCKNLQSIHIPSGTRQRFEEMLPDFKEKFVEQAPERHSSIEITNEEMVNSWTDQYGVKYSTDRKRLISAPLNLTEYIIRGGTEIIEDNAFSNHFVLFNITLPYTVKRIGNRAFWGCSNLGKVNMPAYVTNVGTQIFDGCRNLSKILIPMGTMQKYELLLSDYKDKLVEIDNGWKLKNTRSFTADETSAVVLAKVVPSQYGLSVRFDMVSGLTTYIPLSTQSNLNVDDVIDLSSAKLITLSREGDEDIYRVLE